MIDFDSLETQALEQQNEAPFAALSKRFVPGEGDNPRAFIIGEAPGAQEEIQGRPFVGPAGIMLRRLMLLAGLHADWRGKLTKGWVPPSCAEGNPPNCWLTNVVKFRPPRNRTPLPAEIECAKPYIEREWFAVGQPSVIVPVGGVALKAVMGKNVSILRLAGEHILKTSVHNGQTIHVWPMIHPSFAMRLADTQPGLKELLENHWLAFGEWVQWQD